MLLSELVVVAWLLFFAVFQLLMWTRQLQSEALAGARKVIVDHVRLTFSAFTHLCRQKSSRPEVNANSTDDAESDRISRHIQCELLKRRTGYAWRSLTALCVGVFATTIAMICREVADADRNTTQARDVLLCVASILLSLAQLSPCLSQGRYLDFWHVAFSLNVLAFVSPWAATSTEYLMLSAKAEVVLSIFIGILNLNVRVSWITNALIQGASIWSYLLCSDAASSADRSLFIQFEITVFFAKICLLCTLEEWVTASIRHEVKARVAQGQQSAVSALLSMVCDAVIELDEHLQCVSHNPTLANTLFLGAGKSLQGCKLEQYVWPEDQAKFIESFTEDVGGPSGASMFHLRLRDAWGNAVSLEAFHVRFETFDNSSRHLIGLREHTDLDNKDCFGFVEAGLRPNVAAGLTAMRAHRGRDLGPPCTNYGEQLQVDVLAADDLPITYASPKFRRRYGNVSTFAEVISDPENFSEFLFPRVDEILKAVAKVEETLEYKKVSFGMRGTEENRAVGVYFPDPELQFDSNSPRDRSQYKVSILIGRRAAPESGESRFREDQFGERNSSSSSILPGPMEIPQGGEGARARMISL